MKVRVRARAANASSDLVIHPTAVRVRTRPQRVLDFDIEARPLHWIANDYVSKEVTAMAWAWTDQPDDVVCCLLGELEPESMLRQFSAAYDAADIVTGHFIRGFDLPTINGALMEYGLPTLSDKWTHDTKLDLVRRAGISVSQENLAAMLRLEHDKVKMNQAKWRQANRLTPEGLRLARERVSGDVRQHMELRTQLTALGYLGPPVLWRSGTAPTEPYVP